MDAHHFVSQSDGDFNRLRILEESGKALAVCRVPASTKFIGGVDQISSLRDRGLGGRINR